MAVEIPKGASAGRIGEILEDAGVIDSARGFRIATFTEGGFSEIQAGLHMLPTGLTARDALDALIASRPQAEAAVNVTFPENLWLEDFAEVLEEETHLSGRRFLRVLRSGKVRSKYLPEGETNMEGLLFPSTYQIIERDTELDVAGRLAEELEERAAEIDLDRRARSLGMDPYEAIIIASMIEAEAKHESERRMISRVIYNRIEAGEKLGIDATVYYALGEHKPTLSNEDLEVDSPYNTRLHPGLPPTPIGAAGASSLSAAVNPADGDWFYYVVSDCEGHHAFSVTAQEFDEDVAAYRSLDCG